MSISAAMEEALASAPRDVEIIETVELTHPSLSGPIRLMSAPDDTGFSYHEIDGKRVPYMELPLTFGGTPVEFVVCAFEVVPPGFGDDGPTPARMSIDNVSGYVHEKLKNLSGNNSLGFTYRAYRSDDLTAPGEVISGLLIREVEITATQVSGQPELDDISTQAFPRVTYTMEDYPGLWNQ